MAIRDLFRRRSKIDGTDPIGMGDPDGEDEIGEGGPAPFAQELAEFRWVAQQEAVNVARRGVDPERWDNGQMAFDVERAIAHMHEGLRDRLANFTGARLRDDVRDLYELAADVGVARDDLREADVALVQVTEHWRTKQDEVADDELEQNRYYREQSATTRLTKYLIAAVFVVGEFVISGLVFERLFSDLPPGLGYVLAFGVTLALIVIPHYTALGLKEGMNQYHIFEKRALEKAGSVVPEGVERAVHAEEVDDRGFRWAAVIVGAGLLVMVVPLSVIRADEGDGFSWSAFLFLLLLQYCLSGYFFLREWLDHGSASQSLHKLDEQRELALARRSDALADHADAVVEFHDRAEDVIFTLQQASRWDSYIVEHYLGTIRYFRHLVATEHPEAEQFIAWARVPYLGSKTTLDESGYPLDPLSEEHRSLEETGPLGREWWLRAAGDALRATIPEESDSEAADDGDPSWLLTKAPDQLLDEFLDRYFDLTLRYERPALLDDPGLDEIDETAPDARPDSSNPPDVDLGGETPPEQDTAPGAGLSEDAPTESEETPTEEASLTHLFGRGEPEDGTGQVSAP